jgi:hypothetical protein
MQTFTKVGLDALLTPENCALLLIDHQPFQLANVNSHDPTIVINNVTALAKTAKAYGIPTILTTVNEERGGLIFKQVQAVFPDQKTINRTFINSWEDRRVVEAVKKTGRKKLVMAAPGRRCVLQCPLSMRWETATTCTSSPTPRAAFLLRHTIWQSAAWWLRELNPLPGLAWRENFSVIGRAPSALEKSLSFLSTMPALLVLCSCGRRSC